MNKYSFLVSDETINSYGYVVLTNGIDTTHFEKNPVMFYMHDRKNGIIGRWENIRKEGKKLLADAVFDDSTELSKQVKEQVEKGFLRSASIGIDVIEKDTINGIDTITKSRLVEISIVDMPSNENAVKLYRKNGSFVYDLALLNDPHTQNTLINCSIEDAIERGYIEENQKDVFICMANTTPIAYNEYIKREQTKEVQNIEELLEDARSKGKVIYPDLGLYRKIGTKVGAKVFEQLINTLQTPILITEIISGSKDNRNNWTLDDYRKYAPKELEQNPELYELLLTKGKGTILNKSLEWYRKNAPEELKNDPELYKRLLEQNKH